MVSPMTGENRSQTKKILRTVLAALLALTLAGMFYVAVVLGQPQPDDSRVDMLKDQPLLAASPAVRIQSESDMDAIRGSMPVPVMGFLPGGGLTLQSGVSSDAAYEGGFARTAILTYTAEWNGQPLTLTVQSIYPARALSLIPKGDYRIAAVAGQPLAGLQSVRMENGETIRLHAQASDALYVLTVPTAVAADLAALTRSLQLFPVKEGE